MTSATTDKGKRSYGPKFDYSALAATEFDPKLKATRPVALDKTPFPAWFDEVKRTGKGKSFLVPQDAAAQTDSLLRQAASRFDSGINIGVREGTTLLGEPIPDGYVEISFSAADKRVLTKPRKPIAPRRRKGESQADYKKRQDKYNVALSAWNRANNS